MIVVHGFGPVYWGVERYLSDTSLWSRAWLVQDLPPFRRSTHGWRLKVWSDTAVHFGLCKFADAPHRPLDVQPGEIKKWGTNGAEAQEAAEGGGAAPGDALRPLDDGGRVHSGGDGGGRGDAPPGQLPGV